MQKIIFAFILLDTCVLFAAEKRTFNFSDLYLDHGCYSFIKNDTRCLPVSCIHRRKQNGNPMEYKFSVIGPKGRHCQIESVTKDLVLKNEVKYNCLFNKMQLSQLAKFFKFLSAKQKITGHVTECNKQDRRCKIKVGKVDFIDVFRLGSIYNQCQVSISTE